MRPMMGIRSQQGPKLSTLLRELHPQAKDYFRDAYGMPVIIRIIMRIYAYALEGVLAAGEMKSCKIIITE